MSKYECFIGYNEVIHHDNSFVATTHIFDDNSNIGMQLARPLAGYRSPKTITFQRLAPSIAFFVTLLASLFTFVASWSCQTFRGGDVSVGGGGGYGIWSIQDSNQQCQLWTVLFFAYTLDAPLRTARFCSMASMLCALTLIAIQCQLLPPCGRYGGCAVGICLLAWLIHSLRTEWRFNLWSTFFILTYILEVRLVKTFLLEHYSPQTLYRIVRRLAVACIGMTSGTFLILSSKFCLRDTITHSHLTGHGSAQELGDVSKKYTAIVGMEKGVSSLYERPEAQCMLGPTGPLAVATPLLWLLVALLAIVTVPLERFSTFSGNQQVVLRNRPEHKLEQNPDDTAVADISRAPYIVIEEQQEQGRVQSKRLSMEACSAKSPIRPRLGTATTFNADDEDSEHDDSSNSRRDSSILHRLDSSTTVSSDDNKDYLDGDVDNDDCSNRSLPFISRDCHARLSHPKSNAESTADAGPQTTPSKMTMMMTAISGDGYDREDYDDDSVTDNDELEAFSCTSDDDKDDKHFTYSGSTSTNDTILHFTSKPTGGRCNNVLSVVVGIPYGLVVLVLLGSYYENRNAFRAPDTSYNFITDVVCAFDPHNSNDFQTFESRDLAHLAGYQVAHCGGCGECSNPTDIQTYVDTRTTIADSAKNCASVAIFGSDEALHDCLQKEIGFSAGCTTCWVEDMQMTTKHCKWTCMNSMLTGFSQSNSVPDAADYARLNQCVYCDEKRSGPDFVTCSGVARRRLGIKSEFERNPLEQCPHVDVDYVHSNWKNVFAG